MARRLPSPLDVVSGLTVGPSSILGELEEVLLRWWLDAAHSDQTLARMGETVQRFGAWLKGAGVTSFAAVSPAQARGFVLAPTPGGRLPEAHTQHARRTAVRMLYRTLRTLDRPSGDPTIDLALPPRGYRVARPLTADEVTLCRVSAQATPGRKGWVRATAWALGEATAISSEITMVRIRDLDDPYQPAWVNLPGTSRAQARRVELTGWGRLMLTERVQALLRAGGGLDTLLAYGGHRPPGGAKAQASVCNALREVLDSAGLAGEADVRPASLRHWAGRCAYDDGASITAVARLMGHRSLDATAEDIALDWSHTDEARHEQTEVGE